MLVVVANSTTKTNMAKQKETHNPLPHVPRTIARTRKDIKDWTTALNMAEHIVTPQNWRLQQLFNLVAEDEMVISQSRNRKLAVWSRDFVLKKKNGDIADDATKAIKNMSVFSKTVNAIQDAELYWYSLIQLKQEATGWTLEVLPRQNIVPQSGLFYPDFAIPYGGIAYRELPEFKKTIFEINSTTPFGLLNSCTPKFLFKKFALSCWSELCEIYGIPPRWMKTNTADTASLNRADAMMRDMGAAAYFIIDENEEFGFAQGVQTNGDVYNNLIAECKNAISLILSGAIIGQDTKNGSNSKEVASQTITAKLVQADIRTIQTTLNEGILEAFYNVGLLDDIYTIEYLESEDLDQLWAMVKDLLPYYDFDPEYLLRKFGIEVLGKKAPAVATALSSGADFFV